VANVFKVQVTRALPKAAEVFRKGGRGFVRFRRRGKLVTRPLTADGSRYRDESTKWYVQYKDVDGVWQRTPGYTDKDATRQLATELERKVERRQSGLSDPFDEHRVRRLSQHLVDFRRHLAAKANSTKHVEQTCKRIERVLEGCGFSRWSDLSPSLLTGWLSDRRIAGEIGVKTSNYYLAAFKEFCTWMVRDGRAASNPVSHISGLNAELDVRRKRRALEPEEFSRFVEAAASRPPIKGVSGHNRAMLYVLSAWTGYRRRELASVTTRSLELGASPATVRVEAAYSKRRRHDVIPLHPAVVERLKEWLAAKGPISPDEPLFALRCAGGGLRRTSKMMWLDLERARAAWISEAATEAERGKRARSDFLSYRDEDGLYADFHSNRHTFISNLGKAGVAPKVAQELARHSDINLTMRIYSHVGMDDRATAVGILPEPPVVSGTKS
jgi:integrase